MRLGKGKIRSSLFREFIKSHPDGVTTNQIAQHFNIQTGRKTGINQTLRGMDDVYIDRWVTDGHLEAVWCCAPVPESCPRPRVKRAAKGPSYAALNKANIAKDRENGLSYKELARKYGAHPTTLRTYIQQAQNRGCNT